MRIALAMALALGCASEVPLECDLEAATEVVYDADGMPAYPGQALLITHCGGGAFCHASDIPFENRFGAPAGLDFDLTLASTGAQAHEDEVTRLARAQDTLVHHQDAVLSAVAAGSMPPGAAGALVVESSPHFDRVRAFDPLVFEPLPSIESEAGQEILRNFFACGLRVVERTRPSPSGGELAGWIEEPLERGCVDPTWGSLYAEVIAPSCASAVCHDAEEPAAGLDLSAAPGEAAALAERLVGAPALGPLCEGARLAQIDPGFDPERSLLYVKVAGGEALCGRPMPLVGNALSEQRLCALRAWIACGACAEDDDPRCAECTAGAREECGVILGDDGPACAG